MEKEKIFLTKEGLERFKKEWRELIKIKKAKSKGGVPEVFHSQEVNPDYLAFQEDMSFLEDRIAELKFILKNAKLIKAPPKEKQHIVDLGATVVLEEPEGKTTEFMIVSTLEANPSEGKISFESPVGKAIFNRKVGEVIYINSPTKATYKIKKVIYRNL
ncbi:GreA/GreB family elongation factor [bacterium]|nr:GreA/GreB family elongation factor [bacterium]